MTPNRSKSGSCPNCGRIFEALPQKGLRGLKSHLRLCRGDWELRMWALIDKNGPGGCWIWGGYVNSKGYGAYQINGKKMVAVHRYIYQQSHNVTLPRTVYCLHKCDVPRCVNPDHLFLGNDADNAADKSRKGRAGWKLTTEKVREMRKLFDTITQAEIAKRFGVSHAVVSKIYRGEIWKYA